MTDQIDQSVKGKNIKETTIRNLAWEGIRDVIFLDKRVENIKNWLPLSKLKKASDAHPRELRKNTKEKRYTIKRKIPYQSEEINMNILRSVLTTIRKRKQHTQAGKRDKFRHKINKIIEKDLNNKKTHENNTFRQ